MKNRFRRSIESANRIWTTREDRLMRIFGRIFVTLNYSCSVVIIISTSRIIVQIYRWYRIPSCFHAVECGEQAWRLGIVILAEGSGRAIVSGAPPRAASEIRVASKCQSISIGHEDSNGNRRQRKCVRSPAGIQLGCCEKRVSRHTSRACIIDVARRR